jgi:ribonuclease HI
MPLRVDLVMTITLFTDGGSRGNPGPAASAFVLSDPRGRLEGAEHIGTATNNVAEYYALNVGLEAALARIRHLKVEHEVTALDIFSDSKLMVEQVNGRWAVNNETLEKICIWCQGTIDVITDMGITVNFKHVRRELNTEADALVNEVLDSFKGNNEQQSTSGTLRKLRRFCPSLHSPAAVFDKASQGSQQPI